MTQRLRIGVFMGGKSIEREVSFNSGRTVCDHLDSMKYDIVPLFLTPTGLLYILPWRFLHRGKISDFEHRLDSQAQQIAWDDLKNLIDFMYISAHGRYAEDGTLQGFLELLQIPYLGSKILGSAIGMDKIIQKKILDMHGIATPRGCDLNPYEVEQAQLNPEIIHQKMHTAGITFPCIVKPHKEGSSLGVRLVQSADELLSAVVHAYSINNAFYQSVLIEECIIGMEFTSVAITDYHSGEPIILPPTEIVPEHAIYDYDQKYMPGRATKFTPARTDVETLKKIGEVTIATMKALDIKNLIRVDGFVTPDKKIVIFDPNSLSGMAPSTFLFRQAAEIQMSHTQLINHLIETEIHMYRIATTSTARDTATPEIPARKKRVAVLLGGRSNEREISLESGRNIFYKLSPYKYETYALFVDEKLELYRLNQSLLVRNSTKEIAQGLTPDLKVKWNDLPNFVDFVFIGLHGGEGENGAIQGTLEMLGLPYNGSGVFASALCMDKYKTNEFLQATGFNIPAHLLITTQIWKDKQQSLKRIESLSSYPLIVKPHDDGCSVLVSKVKNADELCIALEEIFARNKQAAVVEECIVGTELTVGVIGNHNPQALPPSEVVVTKDILSIEEKFLPGAGENQTPARLPADALALITQTMTAGYNAIGCKGYARIDCFYQNAEQSPTQTPRVVFIEINTLPALTPATCLFHQAAEIGIKPMDFIDMIVQFGTEEHTHSIPPAVQSFPELRH